MKLSDGEKLILVMLAEIYKSQKIKGEIDPDVVLTSVFNDKAWGLKWQYSGLFNAPEDNPPVVRETCNILDMYRLLTSSFERLSGPDKKRVESEAGVFKDYIRYRGFDGNNDEHLGVVSYLVGTLKRYTEIKNPDLNSHSIATLQKYRRMLEVHDRLIDPYPLDGLTADQIIQILNA
jgi:uncharacterized protein YfbU (UPF0304 family)